MSKTARPKRSRDWLNLPNKITIGRLVIAALLFVLFSLEIHFEISKGDWVSRQFLLNTAMGIFIFCVCTDWLDGYLARKWDLVTVFGRIADPFVDKIVICGTFIYLVHLSPLVAPWYAVVILAREFLVTSLRSYIESQGIPFGARWGGKVKMVVQCIAIPSTIFYEANSHGWLTDETLPFFYWLAVGSLGVTMVATLVSAWDYISVCLKSLDQEQGLGVSREDSEPAETDRE